MNQIRPAVAVAVLVSCLSSLIEAFIYDSFLVVVALSLWAAVGQVRVYGRTISADTYTKAFKGAVMALAWPLVPKRRRR